MRRKVATPRSLTTHEKRWDDDFNRCVEFHGHRCPGLAMGYRAARVLMDRLDVKRAPDEELVAIVETDACGADAIQVMTGCTFGKGNFIFRDYGKHAFALMERNGKKAVRVCLLPNALKIDSKQFSLFEKVRQAQATAEEMDQYKRFQQRRTRDILEARPESLFKIEDVSFGIPSKAVIMASELCDVCGESTQVDLLHEIHGQKVCRTCAQQRGWEWLPQ